jgi:hypothetical protein
LRRQRLVLRKQIGDLPHVDLLDWLLQIAKEWRKHGRDSWDLLQAVEPLQQSLFG